jgi:hypothetical protein
MPTDGQADEYCGYAYGLFNVTVNISDYIASNGMICE